jgi:hypothetical protein
MPRAPFQVPASSYAAKRKPCSSAFKDAPRGTSTAGTRHRPDQETFTSGEQQQLARDREERRMERERKEQRCREACAPVIELGANSQCMANCRG